jgi:hypothetical protein
MIIVELDNASAPIQFRGDSYNPVVVFDGYELPVIYIPGQQGPKGDKGEPGSDLTANAKRHAWVSPNSYCGQAPTGSAESANVWTIKRITVATDGSTTVAQAINVNWTDRLTHTYT